MSEIASAVVSSVTNAKHDLLVGVVKQQAKSERQIVDMIRKTVGSGSQPLNSSGRGSIVNVLA